MKKQGIMNSDISRVLGYMGHTDHIAIADCGLPIPDGPERIDLSLKQGTPSLLEVLEVVGEDMYIEKIVMAEEIKEKNPEVCGQILRFFGRQKRECEVCYVSHADFKKMTENCQAVIRTGEATPFANVILQSACAFG